MKRTLFICVIVSLLTFPVFAQTIISQTAAPMALNGFTIQEVTPDTFTPKGSPGAYSGTPLPIPGDGKIHCYEFRTSFQITPSLLDEKLSLFISSLEYPTDIYINGVLFRTYGTAESDYRAFRYVSENAPLPMQSLSSAKANELLIRVYPVYQTTPLPEFSIGEYSMVADRSFWKNFWNVSMIRAASVIGILLFLYFFFLSATNRFSSFENLFFALSCLAFSAAYMTILFGYEHTSELFIYKLSRNGLILSGTFLILFVKEFTKSRWKPWISRVLLGVSGVLSVLFFILPDHQTVTGIFSPVMILYITPQLLVSIVLLVLSAVKQKSGNSTLMSMAFIVLMITSFHDISYAVMGYAPYAWLLPYGYLTVVITIFFLLAREQAKVYQKSIQQAKTLAEQNDNLTIMMEKITRVSNNLIVGTQNLEDNLMKSYEVVESFEESNYSMKTHFENQIEFVEKTINGIEDKIASSLDHLPRAISNQTSFVSQMGSAMQQIDHDIRGTVDASHEAKDLAVKLSKVADESTKLVSESKTSIRAVAEYSDFLTQVLATIEDITERTNLLSINAAIEAARSGQMGHGFAVVATEIRNLAQLSHSNLETSFQKIDEMKKTIQRSTSLSDQVAERLLSIIGFAKESSGQIESIAGLIETQQTKYSEVVQGVSSLQRDTLALKDYADKDQTENTVLLSTLSTLRESVNTISETLNSQAGKGQDLLESLRGIREVMKTTSESAESLSSCLQSNTIA